jgi:hypothetical protein
MHSEIGQQRKILKAEQQTCVCLKVVKGLNFDYLHPKSQGRRNVQNEKLLEKI